MADAMTVPELALRVVTCPRCGAEPGTRCRSLKRPPIHNARVKEAERLIDSAVAYGFVRRVPAGETKP